jgi:L-alanine-DL-glutamate epimerase-like enolase superfamily enzyme
MSRGVRGLIIPADFPFARLTMRIESVDFFYLAMPEVLDIGDGSQDALLVRLRAGGLEAWGECEAAPLVSIASWCCPMSHCACKPISDSVLGQTLDGPEDIDRIGRLVRENSFDLLQADHTLSGIDAAMWDLLGRKRQVPVYELLGYAKSCPKTPYASVLFGDEPQQTLEKAAGFTAAGYGAAKFGWGPFGRGTVQQDIDQLRAAREGLGPEGLLLIDAGTVWDEDVERAAAVLPALEEVKATWLEEPFTSEALHAYAALSRQTKNVKLAAGEGSHSFHLARNLIDFAGISYVQIDAGRIGGITPARQVAEYAAARGVTYVNHTFTSHLALSASLQPYAGLENHVICEYPVELKPLARDLVINPIERDVNGQVRAPEAPGLGVEVNRDTIRRYLVDAEIRVWGELLYRTPEL